MLDLIKMKSGSPNTPPNKTPNADANVATKTASRASTRDALVHLLRAEVSGFDINRPLSEQLDSLALFAVVPHIEREFNITFYSVEMVAENFSSIDELASLVERKAKASKPPSSFGG